MNELPRFGMYANGSAIYPHKKELPFSDRIRFDERSLSMLLPIEGYLADMSLRQLTPKYEADP